MASTDGLLTDYSASSGPPTIEQLEAAEKALGRSIPDDLAEFLVAYGPGEGFIGGGGYLRVTAPEDWASKHTILQASNHWPGLLIFGGDGGGEFFAFDEDTNLYVEVDAIGDLDRRPLGRSFLEFLTNLGGRRYRDT